MNRRASILTPGRHCSSFPIVPSLHLGTRLLRQFHCRSRSEASAEAVSRNGATTASRNHPCLYVAPVASLRETFPAFNFSPLQSPLPSSVRNFPCLPFH